MTASRKKASADGKLRSGWTTGACATAATRAAFWALHSGEFPDPVEISLPRGGSTAFALAQERRGEGWAEAGIIKDAGDDPDVTHGALVLARVWGQGEGVAFEAGEGVGTVTRAGLPVAVGEPAINPVPRAMMTAEIEAAAKRLGVPAAARVRIAIPGGDELAQRTWNPRLGIVGGLSVLGTTGIVTPYSCAAWIHSIHRGIDVARAAGLTHVAAATGSTSERAVQEALGLPDHAMLDMGDFAGGLLKYLRRHPLPHLTIAGGFAKLAKLAAGALDLHSARATVDMNALADWAREAGGSDDLASTIADAPTAMAALEAARAAQIDLAGTVAMRARQTACNLLNDGNVHVDVMVVDRVGVIVAHTGGER